MNVLIDILLVYPLLIMFASTMFSELVLNCWRLTTVRGLNCFNISYRYYTRNYVD